MIHWIRYFSRRATRNVREEWALFLRVVVGFALMLVVVGVFLLLGSNLKRIAERWSEQLQVTAYLKKNTSEEIAAKTTRLIEALPEVEKATYVPEVLAWTRFKKDLGGLSGVLDGLDENPLPASIEAQLPPELRTGPEVERIARAIGSLEAVEEVQYGQEWLGRYRLLIQAVSVLGIGLAAVLLFVGWGSISNLIQLTVFARKDEIEILKLVGATDRFVRAPFLIEGALQGLAASLFAILLLFILFSLAVGSLADALGESFATLELAFLSGGQMTAIILSSTVLSLVASFTATGRHLEV